MKEEKLSDLSYRELLTLKNACVDHFRVLSAIKRTKAEWRKDFVILPDLIKKIQLEMSDRRKQNET